MQDLRKRTKLLIVLTASILLALPFSSQTGFDFVSSCMHSIFSIMNPYAVASVTTYQTYTYGDGGGLDLNSNFNMSGTDVPYQIVNPNPIKDSLVTFQLPKGLGSKFVTVVWDGNGTTSYVFNDTSKLVRYSHSKYLGQKHMSDVEHDGSVTVYTVREFKVYKVKLPGKYYDPTIWALQSVTFKNGLGQQTGYVIATGYINYVLGGVVTAINPFGSTAVASNGYYLCHRQTITNGVGTGFGYIIEDASATICYYLYSVWWDAWPGFGVDSSSGQVYFEPSPYWNTGSSPGCSCITIPTPPVA
jgi:hypothetical protein